MNRKPLFLQIFLAIFLLFTFGCQQPLSTLSKSANSSKKTIQKAIVSPLEAYVKAKDDAFDYQVMEEVKGDGYTTFVVRMVS